MNTTMLTDRDIDVIHDVARYYVQNRPQIQRRRFPADPNGRLTRRRLQLLVEQGFINRQKTLFCHPTASPGPVYYPAQRGCELLAEHFDDERYLLTLTQPPIPHHTWHWLSLATTHGTFDEAVANQSAVKIEAWVNEFEIVNKSESAPEKRFRLYTLIRENPRLACAPDAAFLLSAYGHSKIFYVEQDRATSGVQQIANGKTGGYAGLLTQNLHLRHFTPSVPAFSVLMIAPSARRRDSLRKAIADKPDAALWRFSTESDVTADNVLHTPIWYSCGKEDPDPLVKRKAEETSR